MPPGQLLEQGSRSIDRWQAERGAQPLVEPLGRFRSQPGRSRAGADRARLPGGGLEQHLRRSGLHREYTLYFLFNVVGLGIGLACLGISHYLLGRVWPVFTTELADIVSANVVGMALGTLFRFWSYRKFVFPHGE